MKAPKGIKVGVGIIVGVLLLLVAITLIAPIVARNYLNDNGPELIGRKIYLDDLSVNVFTGDVSLDSLIIYEADEQRPFVRLRHFDTDVEMLQLLTGVVNLKSLNIDRLGVRIEQTDSIFNFSDILDFFADTTATTHSDTVSVETKQGGIPVVLQDINITNSFVRYQDLKVHSDFKLRDFSLHIPGIDLRQLNTTIGLSLDFVEGGSFATGIDYNEQTGDFRVSLKLARFNLHTILPYVQQSMNATDMQGLLDAHMNVAGNLNHILELQIAGETQVTDFVLSDLTEQPCFSADTISLGTSEVNILDNRFGFSHIQMKHPSFRVEIETDSIDNFTRMLTTAVIDQQEETTEAELDTTTSTIEQKPLDVYVNDLRIVDGQLVYTDRTMRYDPFTYRVSGIQFVAPEFSLLGNNNIAIACQPGSGKGNIKVGYQGRLDDLHNMTVNVDVNQVELRDFSPYTVQMFGNPLTAGTLNFTSRTSVKSGALESDNRLVVRDPVVEKKRRDVKPEMNLPFKTGIYLLTDINNVCDMSLPVRGNIDEPEFSVKKLIFRTLGKLIVKVAASPFKLGNATSNSLNYASDSLKWESQPLDSVSLDMANDSITQLLMNKEYE